MSGRRGEHCPAEVAKTGLFFDKFITMTLLKSGFLALFAQSIQE
jgi:hypothetical protein